MIWCWSLNKSCSLHGFLIIVMFASEFVDVIIFVCIVQTIATTVKTLILVMFICLDLKESLKVVIATVYCQNL